MGVVKTVRLEKVTYPDGREVNYDYGTTGAIDDIMSRLASIKDDDGSTVLASYKYLGAGRIVTEDYEDIEVNLDYNANDNLGGLDRFGRVADQVWNDYGATPDVVLDRYTYTYDRVGNRLSRDNELHAAFDEDYTYDALYRLISAERADDVDQSWTLDGLGNWGAFDDDGTSQTRTANEANEITAITGGWITPAYDAAGNMISGPKPGDETTRVHYIYDAWNRLTEVRADDSGTPGALIAEYSYDGLNRRIEKEVAAGSVDTHYFYNTSWQCMEERVEVSGELPADADVQYVWGAKYVDDLILRDRDTDANGTMDERLYALADANYNVTALVNAATGAVVERFLYDAYGTVTELDPDFTPYTGTDYDWQYTYTTRRLDEETGLMYYRNRYYDAELGQFISRDPSRHPGYDANLYRYTFNGPTMLVDPSGLQPPSAWGGGPHDIPFEPIGPGVPSVLPPGDIDFDDLGALAGRLGDELVNEIRFQVSEYCKRFAINECDCRDVNLQFSDGFQQSFVLGNGITLECTGNVCVVAGGNLGGGIHVNPDPFDPTADAGIQAGAGGQVDINFGINIQVPPVNVGPGAQLQLGGGINVSGSAGGFAGAGYTAGLTGTNGYTSTGAGAGYDITFGVGACLTFDCMSNCAISAGAYGNCGSGGSEVHGGVGLPDVPNWIMLQMDYRY